MCRWRGVIAGSSAPISPIRNLFSQNQQEIASTCKQIVMVGRPEVLTQSLPSFRYRLSAVYQKSLNVSKQNCNAYWSKVWIQLTLKFMRVIYRTAVPTRTGLTRTNKQPEQVQEEECARFQSEQRRRSTIFHVATETSFGVWSTNRPYTVTTKIPAQIFMQMKWNSRRCGHEMKLMVFVCGRS